MDIHQQTQGAVAILKPSGPLTEADAERFKQMALESATRNLGRVIIDAAAMAFVDSRGIEVLADITEELGNGGRALKLCAANPTVQQVLAITGWADAFEFFEDVNTGVRSFL
jgi:anti-anti-sigma factor